MKFGQILVCCMTNISNMFLTESGDWKLVPGSFMILFYNGNTARSGHFNARHIPFLIVLYSPFRKNETLASWHIWLLSNWGRLLN